MIINNLIFSGGALKGICYIGVLKYFEESASKKLITMDIKKIYGVSVGSVTGLLYILGYTHEELEDEILNKNFSTLQNINIRELISSYGIDNCYNILNWIKTLMIKKCINPDITFEQLYEIKNIEFNIISTNINLYKHDVFNHVVTPNMSVLMAIRMSINIPLLFSYVIYNNHFYIDGSLSLNYPINLINQDEVDNTIGIKFKTKKDTFIETKISDIIDYIYNIIQCFLYIKEKNFVNNNKEHEKNTIYVETGNLLKSINFKVNKMQKKEYINDGYINTKTHFETHFNLINE